jgi:hypothetical protein
VSKITNATKNKLQNCHVEDELEHSYVFSSLIRGHHVCPVDRSMLAWYWIMARGLAWMGTAAGHDMFGATEIARVGDETLLDKSNSGKDVFADSAYRSAEAEEKLAARGFRSRICVRGARARPLSKAKAAANRAKSRIRARIEHVFGAQQIASGGRLVRTIGIVRSRVKIGLQNFVYNIRRLVTLERKAAA